MLIETSRRLGGRATSFVDTATGRTVDNCQHVLLGCCTNLLDLYRRLGVEQDIAWHRRLHFFDKAGHHDVLVDDELPAPLHLTRALWSFGTLGWRDKLAVSRGMWRIMRLGRSGREALAGQSFAQWLDRQRQTTAAVERFWSPIVISACNQTPDQLSCTYAMQVFQEGFLAHRDAYVMGVASVPLVRLYDPAEQVIAECGGQVLLGTSVEKLQCEGGRIVGVQLNDEWNVAVDACISALPFDRLDRIIDEPMRQADERLRGLDQLTVSPILGIHLWFDRVVLHRPHMIFVDSPLQWIFNKHATPDGQYLHGVMSAARDWLDRSADEIVSMAMDELHQYLPTLRGATLTHSRVIKEKRATFAAVPGVDAYRPPAQGAIENMYLAGDWCATGWPATMEGAVRSGYAAAGALLGENLLIDDLPPSELYRWLAGPQSTAR